MTREHYILYYRLVTEFDINIGTRLVYNGKPYKVKEFQKSGLKVKNEYETIRINPKDFGKLCNLESKEFACKDKIVDYLEEKLDSMIGIGTLIDCLCPSTLYLIVGEERDYYDLVLPTRDSITIEDLESMDNAIMPNYLRRLKKTALSRRPSLKIVQKLDEERVKVWYLKYLMLIE